MILRRCKKGHYYDGDKYKKCPHCLEEDQSLHLRARHILKRNSSRRNPQKVAMPLEDMQDDSVTMPLEAMQDDSVTMPLEAMQDDSVTMPLRAEAFQYPDGAAAFSQKFRLAAGWLVCIKGKDFGRSFTVINGKNYIGRSAKMDIALHKDNKDVREKHVAISYMPKQKKFIAEPGEMGGLFYLNGEAVQNPVVIKTRDVIAIGNTSLMFVPFCGEGFCWEEIYEN